MSESLNDMLQQLTDELPGFLHTSVIDADTGLALVANSETDSVNAAGADAFHADLYRMSRQALEQLPVGDEPRQFVMRSDEATFVSAPVSSTGYIWMVVTRPDTTVGFVQAMIRKHLSRIEEGITQLV